MAEIYEHKHTVRPDEIDALGHASNICYIAWLQSAAIAHSVEQGWPTDRYQAAGQGWVVRSHFIEYLMPAQRDDEIVIRTWVSEIRRVTSRRKYEIVRAYDGVRLAQAETVWAFVDLQSLRPVRIPADVVTAFIVVESAESP